MKFKIWTLKEAIEKTPEEEKAKTFNSVALYFENLIKKDSSKEKIIIGYIHNVARTLNDENAVSCAKKVTQYESNLAKFAQSKKLNWSACKDFFYTLAEVVYSSRYEIIDGKEVTGLYYDFEEIYRNRFEEAEWLEKQRLIY